MFFKWTLVLLSVCASVLYLTLVPRHKHPKFASRDSSNEVFFRRTSVSSYGCVVSFFSVVLACRCAVVQLAGPPHIDLLEGGFWWCPDQSAA